MSHKILRNSTIAAAALALVAGGVCWPARMLHADDVPVKSPFPPNASSPQLQDAVVSPADPLAREAERAIQITGRRFLETDVHTPWQIVHGLLAYRQNYVIKQHGQKVNALQWMTSGPIYKNQPWFEAMSYGAHAHPYNGVPYAFQGHPSQFLAYMTMCDLPVDFQFKTADGSTVTMGDFVRGSQMEVNDREEVTWTLWFLAHYLDSDAHWVNNAGEPWSLERLVQVETRKTVTAAACGGTHGLFALAYARNGYRASGRPLYGAWFEADQKVKRYVEEARVNQNSDGTFSSNYFKGPGYSRDFDKRLASTGHILEFLCVALPQSRMSDGWIRNAVGAIATDLIQNRDAAAECGALYHAVDALMVYRTRMWPELDPTRQLVTAAKPVAQPSGAQPASTSTMANRPSAVVGSPEENSANPAVTRAAQ